MSLILYSVFHKPFIQPETAFIKPIYVGEYPAENDFLRDNTGDNISSLNPYFCELTAMYWIWKNADRSDVDLWGLCHYRRYFTKPAFRLFGKSKALISASATQRSMNKFVNQSTASLISELLQSNQLIQQIPLYLYKKGGVVLTLEQHYRKKHLEAHWDRMQNVLLEMYPDYAQSFNKFRLLQKISFFNMAVAGWKFWDDYFSWLFPLLFRLHAELKLPKDPYQSRAIGFLSERLINLYVLHNEIKTAYLPVVVFDKK